MIAQHGASPSDSRNTGYYSGEHANTLYPTPTSPQSWLSRKYRATFRTRLILQLKTKQTRKITWTHLQYCAAHKRNKAGEGRALQAKPRQRSPQMDPSITPVFPQKKTLWCPVTSQGCGLLSNLLHGDDSSLLWIPMSAKPQTVVIPRQRPVYRIQN